MERLGLWLVGPEDRAFAQYVPGNLRPLLGREDTVCVGAVYEGMACGAALAELERGGSCYLRYLFVDPAARLCGLGTYLLRGLMGKARELGACQVKALYTPSMLERKDQSMGVLERAGFSRPKPVATQFSAWLGDIPGVKFPEVSDLKVYSALELPQNLWEVYSRWQQEGELPGFVDISMLENPERELSYNYSGLPSSMLIDQGIADRVRAVSEKELKKTFSDLLTEGEIQALWVRFQKLSKYIDEMEEQNLLVPEWNDETAKKQLMMQTGVGGDAKDYYSRHLLALNMKSTKLRNV